MSQETSGPEPLDEALMEAKIWIGGQCGLGVEEEGLTFAGSKQARHTSVVTVL